MNFGKRVKERLGDGKASAEVIDALRAEFEAYDAQYSLAPGERRSNGDPIGDMAWELAESRLRSALSEKGVHWDSIPKEKRDGRIAQIASDARVLAEAKRRVDFIASAASGQLA